MKFLICFRVEQTLAGSIEVEADSVDQARALFDARGFCSGNTPEWNARVKAVDEERQDAKLDLDDSQDSIVEVQAAGTGRVLWEEAGDV